MWCDAQSVYVSAVLSISRSLSPARISASSRATLRLRLMSETMEAAVEVLVCVAEVAVTEDDVDADAADEEMALLIKAAVAAALR